MLIVSYKGYPLSTTKFIIYHLPDFFNADIVAAAVLSGNRNFEGRVHPLTRANYLASPPLVVAYALAGTVSTLLPLHSDKHVTWIQWLFMIVKL